MSEEPGPCFGFKKKTVVMTCIAMCCLSLVAWTVVMTIDSPTMAELASGFNDIENITNITINVVNVNDHKCKFNSSEPLEKVRMILFLGGKENNITRRNFLRKSQKGKFEPLCKCFCKLNITEEMLKEALQYLQLNATLAPFTATTTPLPSTPKAEPLHSIAPPSSMPSTTPTPPG